jgi:hypothetical protein
MHVACRLYIPRSEGGTKARVGGDTRRMGFNVEHVGPPTYIFKVFRVVGSKIHDRFYVPRPRQGEMGFLTSPDHP